MQALGVQKGFDPSKADLSSLIDIPGTYVGDVLHKTFIQVDRNGTKAAAVSAMSVFVGCVPDFDRIKTVVLNRPFTFATMHRKTGIPVFVGKVRTTK